MSDHEKADSPEGGSEGVQLEREEFVEETRCGVLSWRPQGMQRCANMKAFSLTLSLVGAICSINQYYYVAVITQIERRFGLSSAMTGFLRNVDNLSALVFILLVSHFFRFANKPRLFAISSVAVGLAVFLKSIPHFIYGAGNEEEALGAKQSLQNVTNATSTTFDDLDLCYSLGVSEKGGVCRSGKVGRPYNAVVVAIFVVSELLSGIAQSPQTTLGITYMDDNTKNTPLYIGIMFATRTLAPAIGFGLAVYTNRVYVDLGETTLTPKDQRWVGAWWVGFVISSVLSILVAIPIAFFPPALKDAGKLTSKEREVRTQTLNSNTWENLQDLPKAIVRILKNTVYVTALLALAVDINVIGYIVFLPKYLEKYFHLTASKTSVYAGLLSTFTVIFGSLIGGKIVSRLQHSPTKILGCLVLSKSIAVVGSVVLLLLRCPEQIWAGLPTTTENGPLINSTCNSDCVCDPEIFNPVCGADSISYTSPCQAGCTEENSNGTVTLYSGCSCVESGYATKGACESECASLVPYMIVSFITKICTSVVYIGAAALLIKIVDFRDKALGVAGIGFVFLIASFPGPMLFGYAIDTTCTIRQSTCGKKGSCLLYNMESFRLKIHTIVIVVQGVAVGLYALAMIVSKKREQKKRVEASKERAEETVKKEQGVNSGFELQETEKTNDDGSHTGCEQTKGVEASKEKLAKAFKEDQGVNLAFELQEAEKTNGDGGHKYSTSSEKRDSSQ